MYTLLVILSNGTLRARQQTLTLEAARTSAHEFLANEPNVVEGRISGPDGRMIDRIFREA